MRSWFWSSILLPCLLLTACTTSSQDINTSSTNQSGNPPATASKASVEPSGEAKKTEDPIYYGKWKADKVIGHSTAGLPSEEKILPIVIGKVITFSADSFTSGDVVLKNPEYTQTYETATEFSTKNKISNTELNLPDDKILYVEVSNRTNPKWTAVAHSVYVRNKDSLIINAAGYFVELIRE